MKTEDTMKEMFPKCYPKFLELLIEEAKLFEAKNHDYTGGGGNAVTGNFDRVAKIMEQYPCFPYADPRGIAMINMLKQFDAIMWSLCMGYKHKVEGIDKRAQDLSIYSKLLTIIDEGR